MSTNKTETNVDVTTDADNERQLLEERAKKLDIKHIDKMNTDTLRERVNNALAKANPETPEEDIKAQQKKLRDEQLKLVRIVLTPNTQEYENHDGYYCTISNSMITYSKFIPFGVENGWHVPQIIYNHLVAKQVQRFITKKVNNINRTVAVSTPAFTVVVLPALTPQELENLKKTQLARGINNDV